VKEGRFPFPFLFYSPFLPYLLYLEMPTSSGAHSRTSRPPIRYPALEPIRPTEREDPSGTPDPVSLQEETNPMALETPVVEQPSRPLEGQASPSMQSLASPLEMYKAQVQELLLTLRETLDRQAELEERVSYLEGRTTRLSVVESAAAEATNRLADAETRIAVLERLTLQGTPDQKPVVGMARDGVMEMIPQRSTTPHQETTADPKGQRETIRTGKRDKKSRESRNFTTSNAPSRKSASQRRGDMAYLSSSDSESVSTSSSEDDHNRDSMKVKGPPVPGLAEIIPSRSDYRHLVSYRTYRLEDCSQRFDPTITAKLSSYAKRLKHSIEDKFSGDEPIEVLQFLRTFKEAADHNRVGEGAAARLVPYFLKGMAKEGYRAQMDETPLGMPKFPFMVQWLLETYALDDDLAKAYMAATTARMLEGEDERAFGRRLHRAAIRAGNVIDKSNLKTIYVEGLPPFVQAGLRMHLTPDMSFEKVQRLAFSLGTSLRQTILQSANSSGKAKVPLGVKTFLPRAGSVQAVEVDDQEEEHEAEPSFGDIATPAELEVALAHTQLQSESSPLTGRPSWGSSSRSPSPSVVSIPTRGWTSPGGSIMSEPVHKEVPVYPSRVGVNKPPICFLCYVQGHLLAECPRLPPVLQKEAAENREAFQRNGPQWYRPPSRPPMGRFTRGPVSGYPKETRTGHATKESFTSLEGPSVPIHMIQTPDVLQMESLLPSKDFTDHLPEDLSENAEEGS
jgi:hypothetical protein